MTVADIVDSVVFASPVGGVITDSAEISATAEDSAITLNLTNAEGIPRLHLELRGGIAGSGSPKLNVYTMIIGGPEIEWSNVGFEGVWNEAYQTYVFDIDHICAIQAKYAVAVTGDLEYISSFILSSDSAKYVSGLLTEGTRISVVDIRNAVNLAAAYLSYNNLVVLNMYGEGYSVLTKLQVLHIDHNWLSATFIDEVIATIVDMGLHRPGLTYNYVLRVDSNSPPSSSGVSNITLLINRGWDVLYDYNGLAGPDLHASWNCDEVSGPIIDYSSYGLFDLTPEDEGSPSSTDGKIYVISRLFNGSQYFYYFSARSYLAQYYIRALECWIYPTNDPPAGEEYCIWSFGEDYKLSLINGMQICYNIEIVQGVPVEYPRRIYSDSISLNEWHQIVITWDSFYAEARMHVDYSNVYFHAIEFPAGATGYEYFHLGCDNSDLIRDIGPVKNFFIGRIGPVRIWDRVLNSEQIYALWNSGSGLTSESFQSDPEVPAITGEVMESFTASPIAFWGCNEGVYGTIYDDIGSTDILPTGGNSGSRMGKLYDSAVCYNTSASQYHSASSASTIQLSASSDFTVEAWIQPSSSPATGDTATIISHNNNWSLELLPTAKVRWNIHESASTQYVDSNNAISTGCGIFDWHHLLSWYDESASRMYLQVDDQSMVDNPNTDMVTFAPTDSQPLYLGWGGNSGVGYFDGAIGPVRLWNCIFSASERDALYNDGNGLDLPTGLITATLRSDS